MAIAQVVAGARILISDLNAYYSLLKGATGETVTLVYNAAGSLIFQPSSDPAAATQAVQIKNNSGTVQSALTFDGNGVFKTSVDVSSSTTEVLLSTNPYSIGAAGLGIGGDTVLYRSAASTLRTNSNIIVDGTGTITGIATVTGASITVGPAGGGKVIAAGTLTAGGLLGSGVQIASGGPIVYSGSGAPSISAAVKGSLYLRSDGSSTSTRAYIATDTAGTWTAITTVA